MKSPEADLGLLQRPRRCWSPLLESASGVLTLKSNDITYCCPVGYVGTFCWVLQTTTMEYAIRHFPSNYWLQKGPAGTQRCPTTLLQQLEDFFAQYRGKSWKATSYKYEKFSFFMALHFSHWQKIWNEICKPKVCPSEFFPVVPTFLILMLLWLNISFIFKVCFSSRCKYFSNATVKN